MLWQLGRTGVPLSGLLAPTVGGQLTMTAPISESCGMNRDATNAEDC
jgi:hypothetical protein